MPADEAADLIEQLPAGSHYRGAMSAAASWGNTDYLLAEITDTLHLILYRLGGYPEGQAPVRIARPGDAEKAALDAERMRAAAKADGERRKRVSEQMKKTRWEAV